MSGGAPGGAQMCAAGGDTPAGRGLGSAGCEGMRGQRAARARHPPQGPAQEAFGDSYGVTGLPAEAPPAPLCLPGESGPRGQGASPAREGLHQPFQPCWLRPGLDLVRLQLSLAAPTSLFNKEATAWLRGRRKTRRSCAGCSAVTPCVFPVTSCLCKRRRLFALGDNVSRERKSALVNSSARDPKCLWLGEVLLTLSPGGSNPPRAGQGLSRIRRPETAPGSER